MLSSFSLSPTPINPDTRNPHPIAQDPAGTDETKQNKLDTHLHLDDSTHSTLFIDADEEEFTKALEEKIAESRREVQSLLKRDEDLHNTTLRLQGSLGAQTPEAVSLVTEETRVTEETGSLLSTPMTPSRSLSQSVTADTESDEDGPKQMEEDNAEDEEPKSVDEEDQEPKTIDIDDMIAKKEESIRVREATARAHERRQRLEVRHSERWTTYLSMGVGTVGQHLRGDTGGTRFPRPDTRRFPCATTLPQHISREAHQLTEIMDRLETQLAHGKACVKALQSESGVDLNFMPTKTC